MTKAMIRQINYWTSALRQANKSIRRKNKLINRLQRENAQLNEELAELHIRMTNFIVHNYWGTSK